MANRTFKVYGQAYAASGDVSVTMSVGGTQVFSGAVNDSSTVRSGNPTTQNHLWTYTLDENTAGDLAVSIAVSGGELCLGPTYHNGTSTPYITDQAQALAYGLDDNTTDLSAEAQTWTAGQIGEAALNAQKAGLYAKLVGGTATAADDFDDVEAANVSRKDWDNFTESVSVRDNPQLNGSAYTLMDDDEVSRSYWPILQDGDTLTYTWKFSPDPA